MNTLFWASLFCVSTGVLDAQKLTWRKNLSQQEILYLFQIQLHILEKKTDTHERLVQEWKIKCWWRTRSIKGLSTEHATGWICASSFGCDVHMWFKSPLICSGLLALTHCSAITLKNKIYAQYCVGSTCVEGAPLAVNP